MKIRPLGIFPCVATSRDQHIVLRRHSTLRRFSRGTGLRTAVVLIALSGGCDQHDDRSDRAVASSVEEAIGWSRVLRLHESDEVINVNPSTAVDPHGGYLVADEQEQQIRRYLPTGELAWYSGRRGSGPGEFTQLKAARRLPSGGVVAADLTGRITIFQDDGQVVIRTAQAPVDFLEEIEVIDDSLLLLTGIHEGNREGPRLHVWNHESQRLVSSFFSPYSHASNSTLATTAGWTRAALRGDTVAAVFAVSDTVYLFTVSGAPLEQIPFRSGFFRRADSRPPPESARENPIERAQWLASFDYSADVQWLDNGHLLVSYISLSPDRAMERSWHLLRITRDGERVMEVRNAARLLAVHPQTDSLIFVKPEAEVPNEWAIAHLKE